MTSQSSPRGIHWRSKPSFVLATVAVCMFTDLFLYALVIPVLPFLLRDRLHVPQVDVQRHTSGLLAAYSGASVLFSIPSGWAADKIGARKPPLLFGMVLLVIGTALFAVGNTLAVLFIARVFQGMAAAVVWTVGLAIIQDTVGPAKMGQAIGTIFSIITAGELVAPALGGMLYDAAGVRAVFGLSVGVLAVDIVMRFLLVDAKRTQITIDRSFPPNSCSIENQTEATPESTQGRAEAQEDTPLLPISDNNITIDGRYKVQAEVGLIVKAIPVVYCLREPKLLMAMLLCIIQGSIIGIFDATVAIEASSLFGFSSTEAGLVFSALIIPYIGLGPAAGMAVDKYGTKIVATSGYAFLVPCLAILGLPSEQYITGNGNIALFCLILALNGSGLAVIGSPSFVEASDVSSKYEAANPGFFGDNGPYAQVFGFNSLFLFAGLTIGPIVGGALRNNFGYGVMGFVFASLATVTSILSYFIIGEKKQAVEAL